MAAANGRTRRYDESAAAGPGVGAGTAPLRGPGERPVLSQFANTGLMRASRPAPAGALLGIRSVCDGGTKDLILRSPRSGRLEGRAALLQPNQDITERLPALFHRREAGRLQERVDDLGDDRAVLLGLGARG